MNNKKVLNSETRACLNELIRRQEHFAAVVIGGKYSAAPPDRGAPAGQALGEARGSRNGAIDCITKIDTGSAIVNQLVLDQGGGDAWI